MTRIALVGTGLVGRAWAISFARAGHEVRLFDPNETVAEEAVAFAADMVADAGSGGSARRRGPRVRWCSAWSASAPSRARSRVPTTSRRARPKISK